MNKLYYRFRGMEDVQYSTVSSCMTHLYGPERWSYETVQGEDGLMVPRPDLDDIVAIEYRLRPPEKYAGEEWIDTFVDIVRGSRLMEHYRFNPDQGLRYVFNLSTPRHKAIFLVSVLRYVEEKPELVKGFIEQGHHEKVTPDQWLALFSACHGRFSLHFVYQPAMALRGFFEDIDRFYGVMFQHGDPLKSSASSTRGLPSQALQEEYGVWKASIYDEQPETFEGWFRYFGGKDDQS